jgi:hypothetical protein
VVVGTGEYGASWVLECVLSGLGDVKLVGEVCTGGGGVLVEGMAVARRNARGESYKVERHGDLGRLTTSLADATGRCVSKSVFG